MTVVNPLNPLELLAGELAYACNHRQCPCLCVENCPFDIQHPCADITFADWIFCCSKLCKLICKFSNVRGCKMKSMFLNVSENC